MTAVPVVSLRVMVNKELRLRVQKYLGIIISFLDFRQARKLAVPIVTVHFRSDVRAPSGHKMFTGVPSRYARTSAERFFCWVNGSELLGCDWFRVEAARLTGAGSIAHSDPGNTIGQASKGKGRRKRARREQDDTKGMSKNAGRNPLSGDAATSQWKAGWTIERIVRGTDQEGYSTDIRLGTRDGAVAEGAAFRFPYPTWVRQREIGLGGTHGVHEALNLGAKSLLADPHSIGERINRLAAPAAAGLATISTPAFGAGSNSKPQTLRRASMPTFVPRPFPPPALANVPVEYIVDQLHSLAPNYWSKPETADCTIIVPLPTLKQSGTEQVSRPSSKTSDSFPMLVDQRESSSSPRHASRMVMKLHMDYLSSQSKLLRGIFSGASPIELCQEQSGASTPMPHSFARHHCHPAQEACSTHTPRNPPFTGLPRILPSSSSHPVLLLPVPDPSSLRLLIHYIYFGSTVYLEEALDNGEINWEGLARNVEFLGMGVEIKVFLGRWYGRWYLGREDAFDDDDEYDSDNSSDEDCDDEMDYLERRSSATSLSVNAEDDMDLEEEFKRADLGHERPRGRDRSTRRLGHATSDPGLQASVPQYQGFLIPPSPRGRSE
ncbi:hypothetical protein K474DRAFT_1674297 [Panus rudis PR-1116 ss-1]|nr:hypothetical protein K474DRAFT_1674297 [Panus rudis PR-1116 ss-1]